MSRREARETLNLREYRTAMESIYSTSVNERAIDEAPSAYKPIEDIIGPIAESVDIIDVMRPIYNFKASEGTEPSVGFPPDATDVKPTKDFASVLRRLRQTETVRRPSARRGETGVGRFASRRA